MNEASPKYVPDWQSEVARLEHFSRVRLIVVDLDGTFIRPTTSSLFPSLRELHRSLSHSKYQVAVTVATGRAWAGAQPVVDSLCIRKGMPLILYNGALVIEHQSMGVIRQISIPRHILELVRDACASHGLPLYSYWFTDPVSAALHGCSIERVFATGHFGTREFNGLPVSPWRELPTDLEGCVAALVQTDSPSLSIELHHEFGAISELTCTRSGNKYLELRPVGVDKGTALRTIAEHLGLQLEHVLALGDADNDAEMLEIAGIGVSVHGASDLAIRSSDYECRYGAAEGAVELMRLVKHAKRYFAYHKQK